MSENQPTANSRIAKNTAMLYVRMLFLTAISIYTVRVTLQVLGAMDYGIYNVIANVIASLNFLVATMSSATQRFLSFHLGKRDIPAYNRAFSLLVWGFIALSVIVVVIGELVGPYFVNNVLVIPADKLHAARMVYQFTILTFISSVMMVPYHAEIVANEKMGVYAYFSIADGLMRLGVVLLLLFVMTDKLVLYGGLLALQGWIMWGIYFIYCKVKFPFCKISFVKDKALAKELGSYTGWNLFGTISGMLTVQGQSVLLNMFFGPLINTAKAIGDKVYTTVVNFSVNFFMAVSPQIVKAYAAGDNARMLQLGVKGSKISFFLLAVISFPLLCEMPAVLRLWLGESEVTAPMISFSRLLLIYSLIVSLEPPITQMIRATGQINRYQLQVGLWTLSYIPVAALVLWLGGAPTATLVTLIALYLWVMVIRVRIAHKTVGLPYGMYMNEVAVPLVKVSVTLALVYKLYPYLPLPGGFGGFCAGFAVALVLALGATWVLGLNRGDRSFVKDIVRRKLLRR
ncbi:MAG: hypothetical protein K2H21_07145 [Muribaculaceae bacterium]|nr:hypothetical protein [Muribaculaceae bacterium]